MKKYFKKILRCGTVENQPLRKRLLDSYVWQILSRCVGILVRSYTVVGGGITENCVDCFQWREKIQPKMHPASSHLSQVVRIALIISQHIAIFGPLCFSCHFVACAILDTGEIREIRGTAM